MKLTKEFMKTILNNTETKSVKHYENGYTVDGILQPLGQLAENVWHLEVKTSEQPEYNPETQAVSFKWLPDFDENTWVQEWTVHDLTPYQIAMRDWERPEYSIKIIADTDLVLEDFGVKMKAWFELKQMPVIGHDEKTHLYCNAISEQFQDAVENLIAAGRIVVQYRPEPEEQ